MNVIDVLLRDPLLDPPRAAQRYAELLAAALADRSAKGDEAALRQCMATLGIGRDDLAADADALRELTRLQAEIERLNASPELSAERRAEIDRLRAEGATARATRLAAETRAATSRGEAWDEATRAAAEARTAEDIARRRLLDLAAARDGVLSTIQNRQKEIDALLAAHPRIAGQAPEPTPDIVELGDGHFRTRDGRVGWRPVVQVTRHDPVAV